MRDGPDGRRLGSAFTMISESGQSAVVAVVIILTTTKKKYIVLVSGISKIIPYCNNISSFARFIGFCVQTTIHYKKCS